MLIQRSIIDHLQELRKYYPIISLTGPRQAGKTTLLRDLYADYHYLSFEAPELRAEFSADPRGFLRQYGEKVIFDEALPGPADDKTQGEDAGAVHGG